MMILTNPKERSRFMRFAVVGVIGAVVDFGTMNLLRSVFDTPIVLAGTISFIAAILSNFTWNRYWTYPDSRSKNLGRQLLEFAIISVIGLAIRVPILSLLHPPAEKLFLNLPFKLPGLDPIFLADNFTLAVAVVIVMFWNFFANRFYTYGDVK